jgi:hypothetical protein
MLKDGVSGERQQKKILRVSLQKKLPTSVSQLLFSKIVTMTINKGNTRFNNSSSNNS